MNWYAIRTAPGAQQPQREYMTETTALGKDGRPRGKGYRLVPSLNPDVSAVERALRDNGFTCYMPVEKRLLRDRRKLGLWKPRRFAILIGYIFVENVIDWKKLEETPGVVGVVGNSGRPLQMLAKDMATLRAMEAECEAEYQKEIERRALIDAKNREARNRLSRSKTKKLFPSGSRVVVKQGVFEGREFIVTGMDRDGRLKAIAETLSAIGTISLPVNDVDLAA